MEVPNNEMSNVPNGVNTVKNERLETLNVANSRKNGRANKKPPNEKKHRHFHTLRTLWTMRSTAFSLTIAECCFKSPLASRLASVLATHLQLRRKSPVEMIMVPVFCSRKVFDAQEFQVVSLQ